jgi:hypothetical protein
MARPVKWSRDLHPIRERAANSRTETWSRKDIERLFDIGRASAQSLMKAIGEVQAVGGAHFVERASLLSFLDSMLQADSVEEALRLRMIDADPPPAPKPLRIALPPNLRNVMVRDLPDSIKILPGRLEINAADALGMLESLALLAQALQNDLNSAQAIWDPAPSVVAQEEGLDALLLALRNQRITTTS